MFYTKEVPVESVVIIEGTSPRTEIDILRVAFFRDIYSQKKEDLVFDIPPVDVSLVQTGEPGKEVFALEDGMHRLLAQKEIKLKKIKARIRTDVSISEAELSSFEVKKHLLMKACESNARHGMPLSHEERKDAVRKMTMYGCTNAEIIATGIASKATVYRWLLSEVKEKKEIAVYERVNKKEQVKTLLMQGVSIKRISGETGVPRTTVRRMIREVAKKELKAGEKAQADGAVSITENNGQPYKWMSIDEQAKQAQYAVIPAPHFLQSSDRIVITESTKKKIDEIYDAIRLLDVNDATDYEIKTTVLPLLSQKFPAVAELIRDGGYAIELEALHYELRAAKDELQVQRKELLKRNDLLQQREEQLKKRTEVCNYQCEFTTERLRQEFEKYVNFMVTHINEHVQVIPHVSENDGGIIRQLTTNGIFALLSVLEWGDDNGLTSTQTKEAFEELKDSVMGMDMNNKNINSRISTLEQIYHKIPSMPKSFS
ncbi:MAG: hypothetical protein ABSB95_08600 [Dissulfurispiraceae bacterium]